MAKKKKKKKRFQVEIDDIYKHNPSGFLCELDNCDNMPELPIIAEKKNFKKLSRDEKLIIKVFIIDVVTTFWNEKQQIPMGESLSNIKKTLIQFYLEEYHVILKDD